MTDLKERRQYLAGWLRRYNWHRPHAGLNYLPPISRVFDWCERHGVDYVVGIARNPRFVVTNLKLTERYIYDKLYCACGEMKNRIKDQQFADRTSCHGWWPNQLRQLLSGLAGLLFEGLRRLSLNNTLLAKASPQRIRLTLLKIGAVTIRNTRHIRFLMRVHTPANPCSSKYPSPPTAPGQ